jgi:hypothetical protein
VLFGDPPNFTYDDPSKPGTKKSVLLKVKAANEPGDYIWSHLTMSSSARANYVLLGYALSCLLVAGCTALAIYLNVKLVEPPPFVGTFSALDQRCDDPRYLEDASAVEVQATCGIDGSQQGFLNQISTAQGSNFGLHRSDPAWASYQQDLIRLTPCTELQPESAIRSVAQRDKSFVISDSAHNLFRGCEFLAGSLTGLNASRNQMPLWQRNGQAGFVTNGIRSFCNFGIDQQTSPGTPLRMIAQVCRLPTHAIAASPRESTASHRPMQPCMQLRRAWPPLPLPLSPRRFEPAHAQPYCLNASIEVPSVDHEPGPYVAAVMPAPPAAPGAPPFPPPRRSSMGLVDVVDMTECYDVPAAIRTEGHATAERCAAADPHV